MLNDYSALILSATDGLTKSSKKIHRLSLLIRNPHSKRQLRTKMFQTNFLLVVNLGKHC